MTPRDAQILEELRAATDSLVGFGYAGWVRPLDCGGSSNSDHSYRLSRLAKLGLAEERQRMAHMSRGSKLYRITDAGRAALAANLDSQS